MSDRANLRRELVITGSGATPDWYAIMRAARYLGVAPWDLLQQPAVWLRWALDAEAAENGAAEDRRQMQIDS